MSDDDVHRFQDRIIDALPDMIFVKDAEDLRFVRFNRAGEKLLGIPREEMYGKTDHDFFPPRRGRVLHAEGPGGAGRGGGLRDP